MVVILIIVAALVTATLTIVQHLDAQKQKDMSEAKEISLNNKIDGLLDDNKTLAGKLADLAELNISLSKQLKETSTKLTENTIGGSSLKPNGYLVDEYSFKFQFANKDKLPIYDLFVSVIDLDLAKIHGIVSEDQKNVRFSSKNLTDYLDQNTSQLNVGFQTTMNKIYSLRDGEIKHFFVSIGCRKNSQVMQVIVYKRDKKITEIHRTYEINDNYWKLIEEDGHADEKYWKEMFYNNRNFGFDSTK